MKSSIAQAVLTGVTLILACRLDLTDSPTSSSPRFVADESPPYGDWSAPRNLGAPVNTNVTDQGPSLSKDGLSLYFASARPGGLGDVDIYVSRRACTEIERADCAWQAPLDLGPTINTPGFEAGPTISRDGHRLFFSSTRPGGFGGQDLYVSRRRHKDDGLGWEPPVNLGPGINTAGDEAVAAPFEDDATGADLLYYAAGPTNSAAVDIYVSTLGSDGTYGPGVPVTELNTPSIERMPTIRRDGLELFFASDRPGTLGTLDLWVATRSSTSAPWSAPLNLGPVVNSVAIDARPALSFDGTDLYFQSPRPGGLGSFDLYVTTRAKLKAPESFSR